MRLRMIGDSLTPCGVYFFSGRSDLAARRLPFFLFSSEVNETRGIERSCSLYWAGPFLQSGVCVVCCYKCVLLRFLLMPRCSESKQTTKAKPHWRTGATCTNCCVHELGSKLQRWWERMEFGVDGRLACWREAVWEEEHPGTGAGPERIWSGSRTYEWGHFLYKHRTWTLPLKIWKNLLILKILDGGLAIPGPPMPGHHHSCQPVRREAHEPVHPEDRPPYALGFLSRRHGGNNAEELVGFRWSRGA
jgi:hypothetical protein